MVSAAVPPSGDPGVCAALAVGWQVAELFHSPVHRGPAADPARNPPGAKGHVPGLAVRLPGRCGFPGATQAKWLGEQIQHQVGVLLAGGQQPQPLADAMSAVLRVLGDAQRTRDATLDAIFTLHCRLLEALTVVDFRLGKAYGLGRSIAETVLLPADAIHDEARGAEFRALFEDGRVITIKDWLFDLKTLLPDHTAYAVSRGLRDWQAWVAGSRNDADWASARAPIRVQGRIWRALLTGEKAARDTLNLSHYLAAGRRVAARVVARFWWVILLAAGLIVGVFFVGSFLHTIPPSVKVVADIAWLAGALGISLKGAGTLFGAGLKDVEGWLWASELDGSVAAAATQLPPGAKRHRIGGNRVGDLTLDPDRTADTQRHDALRRAALLGPGRGGRAAGDPG
jgi:hypothetical protein